MGEPAPLLALAEDPAPAGAAAEWFAGMDGARLRACLIPAPGTCRGSVVLSPGRTEPIEKYFEAAGALAARGFTVLIHDWRGQGLSHRALNDRRLGHAAGYQAFVDDYQALLSAFEARLPRPWLALGHSMGGCLTLLALAKGEARMGGAILSAPMLGLKTGVVPRPLAWLLAMGSRMLGLSGRAVMGQKPGAEPAPFAGNVLTHDQARYARNVALVRAFPHLVLGPPTWGWLNFAFAATDLLATASGVASLDIPVAIVAAGEDALVDNVALRRTASRLRRGRYLEIPGARHEILQETDALQAPFWAEFDAMAAAVAVTA